jgi:ABC-type sugar transport system ATPase subunit
MVTLGVRRENVKLSSEAQSKTGIQLRAEVEGFESDFTHQVQIVFLRMGRLLFSGHAALEAKLRTGQSIQLEIDPENLHFFDTKSEQRL